MSWPVVADRKLDRPVCDVTGVQYDTRYRNYSFTFGMQVDMNYCAI